MENELRMFNDYYNLFDHTLSDIVRKYDHTFRVVNYANDIASSLNLTEEEIMIAKKCALFHDIARFKQWTNYKTYDDKLSFDHGDEGYNILKDLGINDEIILLSTKYHNKLKVINDDKNILMFCNITRDADKIDIMLTQNNKCNDDTYNVPDDVIKSLKEKRLVLNKVENVSNDVINIYRNIAFIFDINYKKSFEIIKSTDIINKKFNIILDKFDLKEIKDLKEMCNKYIEERLSE